MTVPTFDDFEEFSGLMLNYNARVLIDQVENVRPKYGDIYKFMSEVYDLLEGKKAEIEKSSVHIWFKKQPNYITAYKLVFKEKSPKRSKEDVISSYTEEVIKRAHIKDAPQTQSPFILAQGLDGPIVHDTELFISVLRDMLYKCGDIDTVWEGDIAFFFMIYFYDSNSMDGVRHYEKIRKELASDVINSISNMINHIDSPVSVCSLRNEDIRSQTLNKMRDLVLELEDAAEVHVKQVRPVKRDDTASKERLLIFNIWKYCNNTGAEAIAELMCIEGVENQTSQRRIERLIQGWKKEC